MYVIIIIIIIIMISQIIWKIGEISPVWIRTDLLYDAVRFSVGLTNKTRLFYLVFITCGTVHFG